MASQPVPPPPPKYAIPFGSYTGAQPGPENDHGSLVARVEPRRQLLRLLYNDGNRSAYLVTGRRGSGKTSFVEHCLHWYERDAYSRYLKGNVGKSFFWDRVGLVLIVALALALAVMCSDLLGIVMRGSDGTPQFPEPATRPVGFLFSLALTVACFSPIIVAHSPISAIMVAISERLVHARYRAPWLPFVFVALIVPFVLKHSRLLDTTTWAGQLCLMLAATDLFGRALMFRVNTSGIVASRPGVGWQVLIACLSCGAAIALALLATSVTSPVNPWLTLVVAGECIGGALVIDAWDQHARAHCLSTTRKDIRCRLTATRRIVGLALLLAGIALGLCLDPMASKVWLCPPATAALAVVARAIAGHCRKLRSTSSPAASPPRAWSAFAPMPSVVMFWKAALFVSIGLHLGSPMVALLGGRWHFSATATARTSRSLVLFGGDGSLDWLVLTLMALALLAYLEYEWIISRGANERRESAFLEATAEARLDHAVATQYFDRTFFAGIYRHWLPVIYAKVNLGFDNLEHRRVVESMLFALRDEYRARFRSLRSAVGLAIEVGAVLAVLLLTHGATARWFDFNSLGLSSGERKILGAIEKSIPQRSACQRISEVLELSRRDAQPVAADVPPRPGQGADVAELSRQNNYSAIVRKIPMPLYIVCEKPTPKREAVASVLYADVRDASRDSHLTAVASVFLPNEEGDLIIRAYDILVFFVLFIIGRLSLGRWLIPYVRVESKISRLIDSLSSRLTEESQGVTLGWNGKQVNVGNPGTRVNKETEPSDPRTVEQAFLQLLREIRGVSLRIPFAVNHLVSFPIPEIVFVFDELDKLGGASTGLLDSADAIAPSDASKRTTETTSKSRGEALRVLFADLKNLISTASARFIFIGGNELHDIWLADRNNRHPLLTNIFSAEIRLPPLMLEPHFHAAQPGVEIEAERRAVASYVWYQQRRANATFVDRSLAKLQLWGAHHSHVITPLRFGVEQPTIQQCHDLAEPRDCDTGEALANSGDVLNDLYDFFSYRSLGNLKRLKELLESLIANRTTVVGRAMEHNFDCEHILLLGEPTRFRIHLIAEVYRLTITSFSGDLALREEKLRVALFYLSDSVLKFHRRAFSWKSLEKVEELVHVSRAADLRAVLSKLVDAWSEHLLHPIRNGMYDFRFHSEVAAELRYLSKQSDEELAALNFTLDESRALKAEYHRRLSSSEAGQNVVDYHAGLGELYSYDEEYERARYHLRGAIRVLDEGLAKDVGSAADGVLLKVLNNDDIGHVAVRRRAHWGVARLRIMLQIGMTHERSRNLESAQVQYRNARTLADSLIAALLKEGDMRRAIGTPSMPEFSYRSTLKHLNILFQPAFAEAWVSEKLVGGVDTGPSLMEAELWNVRHMFFADRGLTINDFKRPIDGGDSRDTNLALVLAELHNKAGDLYFFKGQQLVDSARVELWRAVALDKAPRNGYEGYLVRAHYHYCVSLHEIRRYNKDRRRNSVVKLRPLPRNEHDSVPTIRQGAWPSFVVSAAAGTLYDLTEVMQARTSLGGLLWSLTLSTEPAGAGQSPSSSGIERGVLATARAAEGELVRWLDGLPTMSFGQRLAEMAGSMPRAGDAWGKTDLGLDGWLGVARTELDSRELIELGASHWDNERLACALLVTYSTGQIMLRARHLSDGTAGLIKVAETVAQQLWNNLAARKLIETDIKPTIDSPFAGWRRALPDAAIEVWSHPYWKRLVALGILSLRDAAQYVAGADATGRLKVRFDLAYASMFHALLGYEEIGDDAWRGLSAEMVRSLGLGDPRKILERRIVSAPYPVEGRLTALKLWLDAQILSEKQRNADLVMERAAQFRELYREFDGPFLFTPSSYGITMGVLVTCCDGEMVGIESFKLDAIEELHRGRQMGVMGPAYYDAIADLYYLYDDFNDRRRHVNLGVQFGGTELAALLLDALGPARSAAAPPSP